MEFWITILLVAPAVLLAIFRSTWLMDYAILVIAFNRLIRRLVDFYHNERFNPSSPISLTPLAVSGLMLLAVMLDVRLIVGRTRKVLLLLGGAVGIGLIVGLPYNRLGAVYSLAEWLSGIGALAFAASHLGAATAADRWFKTAGWTAVAVALYGWWQYLTIPPWDAMWLVQANMVGYMGTPEPGKMTCFSTMNERGVCAGFLGMALLPILLNARWRGLAGLVAIPIILSAIFLTEVRTIAIVLVLVVVLQPVLSRGYGLWQIVALSIALTLAFSFGLSRLPGVERFANRFDAQTLSGEGSSLQGRLSIYQGSIGTILRTPLGRGLGSSGMGNARLADTGSGIGDAGYLQIAIQFGWLGSAMFFGALFLLWQEISARMSAFRMLPSLGAVDPFLPAARAVLVGSLVYLFVADIFSGFSLIWVFFGRALNAGTHPAFLVERLQAKTEKPKQRKMRSKPVTGAP